MNYPHSIHGHGAPFLLKLQDEKLVSGGKAAAGLARQFRGVGNVHGIAMPICHSAAGGPFSNAQMLANASGKPVLGYYGRVTDQGRVSGTGKYAPYKVFRPQSEKVARITGRGNSLFGKFVRIGVAAANGVRSLRSPSSHTLPADQTSSRPR